MSKLNFASKADRISFKQTDNFTNDIGHLFNNELFSDLILIVNDIHRFAVHKNILFIRSEWFRTLLTSGLSESTRKEVTIQESDPSLFEKLIRYIYTGEMEFDKTHWDEMANMLVMSDKYLITDLKSLLEDHLGSILSIDNFCSLYSKAVACSAEKLKTKCLAMADSRAQSILGMDGLSDLTVHAVEGIIGRASFKPPHLNLFTALEKWIKANGKKDAEALLSKVRLTDIPMNFVLTTVRQSGLFSESRILDAAATISTKSDSYNGGASASPSAINSMNENNSISHIFQSPSPNAISSTTNEKKRLRIGLRLFSGRGIVPSRNAIFDIQSTDHIRKLVDALQWQWFQWRKCNLVLKYSTCPCKQLDNNATLDSCGIRDGGTIPQYELEAKYGRIRDSYMVTFTFERY